MQYTGTIHTTARRASDPAVRAGNYKLIEHYDPVSIELYDLSKDIGERDNLAAKMPDKAAKLRQKLHDWLKSVNAKMHTLNPEYRNRSKQAD